MASTLTWYNSGLVTKTGTTALAFFNDMNTIITSKVADSNFKWEVASFSTAGNPYYLVVKRKDASVGRILFLNYTGAPAGNNSAILETTPTTGALQTCYFPNGNVDTPSNLAAASGTIMGNDTGVIKACTGAAVTTLYTTNYQVYYFDSAEAFALMWGHGAVASHSGVVAGDMIVDGNDVAYPAILSSANTSWQNFGSGTSPPLSWQGADIVAGNGAAAHVRTNYGSTDRLYFQAFSLTNSWGTTAIGTTDVLTDTTNSKAMFLPVMLLGGYNPTTGTVVKTEGLVLKLRQMAHGPSSGGQFSTYNTTGPVVAARCTSPDVTPRAGCLWFVNFKV